MHNLKYYLKVGIKGDYRNSPLDRLYHYTSNTAINHNQYDTIEYLLKDTGCMLELTEISLKQIGL